MKPSAYMYKKPHQSRWHGVTFANSVLANEELKKEPDLITQALYSIDFTKYKLVPLEPTEGMIDAYIEHDANSEEENVIFWMSDAYRKVIEAAPKIEELE